MTDTDERRQRYTTDGVGWYEVINPKGATTRIAHVSEDGTLYLPEGPDALTQEEFVFAAAQGTAYRLIRVDDAMAVSDEEQRRLSRRVRDLEAHLESAHADNARLRARVVELEQQAVADDAGATVARVCAVLPRMQNPTDELMVRAALRPELADQDRDAIVAALTGCGDLSDLHRPSTADEASR